MHILLILILLGITKPLPSKAFTGQQLKPVQFQACNANPKLEIGRTYNRYKGGRVLAPKNRSYPILDQLEYMIYPSQDFKKQHPGKRLERLEVAVFGDKQKGTIPKRVNKLKGEVESWQIANAQVMDIVSQEKLGKDAKMSYKNQAFVYGDGRQNGPSKVGRRARGVGAASSFRNAVQARQSMNPQLANANPYGANPYGANPYGVNPYATNPYAPNPYQAQFQVSAQRSVPRSRQVDYTHKNYKLMTPMVSDIGKRSIRAMFGGR